MKMVSLRSSKIFPAFVVLFLIITQISCKFGGKVTPTTVSQTIPAVVAPAEAATEPARPADPRSGVRTEGGYDLPDPLLGLDSLSSYRQTFRMTLTGTLQGKPYEENQHVERTLVYGDESVQVSDPVYMVNARLGNYRYTQDQEGGSCRAEAVQADKMVDLNPALRLPAAFGMQEASRETLNNRESIHYTFDEKSLVDQEGVVKKARGEVWVAQDGGAVLKYELAVELAAKEFTGTRSYSYTLEPENQALVIRLPDSCQPVLFDLPAMPGAVEIEMLPGFQRYTIKAARADAASFYYEQLAAQGWKALPGSSPDQADLTSTVTALSFTQPYLNGGRVLVLQLRENDGMLQVIAQAVFTKVPVTVDEETATEP